MQRDLKIHTHWYALLQQREVASACAGGKTSDTLVGQRGVVHPSCGDLRLMVEPTLPIERAPIIGMIRVEPELLSEWRLDDGREVIEARDQLSNKQNRSKV